MQTEPIYKITYEQKGKALLLLSPDPNQTQFEQVPGGRIEEKSSDFSFCTVQFTQIENKW